MRLQGTSSIKIMVKLHSCVTELSSQFASIYVHEAHITEHTKFTTKSQGISHSLKSCACCLKLLKLHISVAENELRNHLSLVAT